MKIACLGWGSLIWNPGSLLIRREWFNDGPLLPIEYSRISNDGRLTLVITENVKPIRTLWALMATEDLAEAKKSLKEREGCKYESDIGSISINDEAINPNELIIIKWAINLNN